MDLKDEMAAGFVSGSSAVIRAHQERFLIERGRLFLWAIVATILASWGLSASGLVRHAALHLPLLNSIELCVLTVALTQLRRPWYQRHVLALSVALGVQLVAFLTLYGLWTGNLWILTVRLTAFSLGIAAVLPWGVAAQGIIVAASSLGFAFVHWSLNGTLNHPATIPTLVLFALSLPIATWLKQAYANIATEIERRRTAEGVLRQATEGAQVAVWDSDIRTGEVRLVSGWDRLLGRDENEITLVELLDLVHVDDRARTTVSLQEHLQGRKSTHDIEHRILHADGSYRWVLSRSFITCEAEGLPSRMQGAVMDITDRKRLEEALQEIEARKHTEEVLRESEELYRGHFEQAAVGIAFVDLDGTWLRLNRRLCDIVGYTEPELCTRTFQEITHPDDLDRDLAAMRDMLDGKIQTHSIEKRYLRKDGSIVWIDLAVSLVREPSGKPKYFIAVVDDIDARRRAESERERLFLEREQAGAALRASEERLRLITETIEEVFWMADVELAHMYYVSPAYERIWGRTPESLYKNPRSFIDAIHPEDRGRVLAELVPEESAPPFDIEFRIIRPDDGSIRWIWDRGFPVHEPGGQISRYVGIAQDITERKHAEQMQQRHERETVTVNNILRAINTHLDVRAAFPGVCAGLRELARCAAVSLNFFDESRERVRFVTTDAPWGLDASQDVCLGAAEFPAATDVLAGRPHIVRDLATELQFPLVQVIYKSGFRSVVCLPLCVGSDVIGLLNLFWREVDGCQSAEMGVLTQVANAVALAVERSRLFEQVSAGQERLAALSRRLMEVQEAERRHIARELHDEIGQHLTAINLLLGGVEHLSLEGAVARLKEVRALVNGLVARVRDVSLDLRPAMLDDFGVLTALSWLFGRYTAQTGITVTFEHRALQQRFTAEQETAVYRIVQEALTNVARHARVGSVSVDAWADDGILGVSITDEGAGFDVDAVLANGMTGGLAGLRERAMLLGGRLTIESKPGAGTRLVAEFPLSSGSGDAAVLS